MDIKTRISRLFIPSILEEEGHISLDAKNSHYLTHVMRAKIGDQVLVFDGKTGEYVAEISKMDRKGCTLHILKKVKPFVQNMGPTLLFAPLKKPRLDFMIEKAVELGVDHLYPIITDHTINRNLNMEKLQEIAIQAAEQSERLSIPEIHEPLGLEKFLKAWNPADPIFVCAERQNCPSLKESSVKIPACKTFFVGPEGGFSASEFKLMESTPFIHFVNLGPEILRAETAAIAVLGWVRVNY